MTTSKKAQIKLEPIDDVVLEIKTIQVNLHKSLQDDFDDEEIAASVAPNFNFDDANKIKMEPAVEYVLELSEQKDHENSIEDHKRRTLIENKAEISSNSRGVKRRHTVIVEEMLDVSKDESLEERIKKRSRRSNGTEVKKQIKQTPETANKPLSKRKPQSKLQIKEKSLKSGIESLKESEKESKDAKAINRQEKTEVKSKDDEEAQKGDSKRNQTQNSTKNSKNQKISSYFKSTEKVEKLKVKPKVLNESKPLKSEVIKDNKQKRSKNEKMTKDQDDKSRIPSSSEKSLKSKLTTPKFTRISENSNFKIENSSKNNKLPVAKRRTSDVIKTNSNADNLNSKIKTKLESSSDSDHAAADDLTDSQESLKYKPSSKPIKDPPDDTKNTSSQPLPSSSSSFKFECKKCFKFFSTKLKLYYHSKIHQPKIECKICGRKIQAYLMNRHIRHHKDNKPFKCDLCPSAFISFVSIRNHMYQHTSVKKFYCDICGRGYNDSRHLREHRLSHTNPYAYRCDMCPKGYERKQALEAHMQANHMKDTKWYSCKICGYKTKLLTVMYSHKKRHDKTIECEDCGKKFSNRSELLDHSLAVHVKVKNVECKICGKFFASKRYMLKHIRRTHADPKKFKCEICENTYKSVDALKQHLRKHDSRCKQCEICKRKVKESYMKKHQASNAECRKKVEQRRRNVKQDRIIESSDSIKSE